MIAKSLLGGLRLTLGERRHDPLVIGHDLLRLALHRQVQAAQAVDMAAAAADQVPEVRDGGRLAQGAVKRLVARRQPREVARLGKQRLLGHEGLEPYHQRPVGCPGQGAHDLLLHGAAQELRLAGGREIDAAHHRRGLREDVDQPLLLEPQERIADRGGAEAEARLQFGPRQHRAGREIERDDLVPDEVEDLRGGVARAVAEALRTGEDGVHDGRTRQ